MAVGTFQDDTLSIDFDQPIFHLYLLEPDAVGHKGAVVQGHKKVVQCWRFGCPLERVFHWKGEFVGAPKRGPGTVRNNRVLCWVE